MTKQIISGGQSERFSLNQAHAQKLVALEMVPEIDSTRDPIGGTGD